LNILGIGSLELLVILLVGFLVLGPRRSVEVSRKIGGIIQRIKTTSVQLANLVEDDASKEPSSPNVHSNRGKRESVDGKRADSDNQGLDI